MKPRASVSTPAASRPRSSVFGRRPIARSTWLPISSGAPSSQLTPHRRHRRGRGAKRMHSAPVRTRTPSRLEDAAHGLGDVGVLAADQPRPLLDHRDLGAEAAEGLGELEADVAAADHDEVAGQRVEGEELGCRGSARRARPAGRGRPARAPTLRKMRSAASARSPTATSRGPVRRAWPCDEGHARQSPPSQSASPCRPSATMPATRARAPRPCRRRPARPTP